MDGEPIKLIRTRGAFSLSLTTEVDDPYLLDRIAEHTLPIEGEILGGPHDGMAVALDYARSSSA